jgi:pimeloyl-ACP methyl ester carboxylesterase
LFFRTTLAAAALLTPSLAIATPLEGVEVPLCEEASLKYVQKAGFRLAYTTAGRRSDPPLILIAGSGMQLIDWPDELVSKLIASGFFVVIFDPRDSGCSSHFDTFGTPDWSGIFTTLAAGQTPPLAYSATDMVVDVADVLDAEKIGSAHVLGASGGAVVAAILAARHPERVRSLTLLMANAGNPSRPIPARPDIMGALAQPPRSDAPEGERTAYLVSVQNALSGPGSVTSAAERQRLASLRLQRGYSFDGVQRQGAALIAAGDLRESLASISIATTVIHGARDPLLPVDAGRDVADAIHGARFVLLPESGHELDPDMIAAAVASMKVQGSKQNAEKAPQP